MKFTGFYYLAVVLMSCLILTTAAVCADSPANSLFQEANEDFSQGDYGQAISKYEQITEENGYSSAVLYNLANSYALSGQTGLAVLNYERALRLSPSNSDISGNLELVKKESGLFPKEPSGVERFFGLLSLNQWTILIAVSLLLLTGFLLTALKYQFSKQLKTGVEISCFLVLVLAVAGTRFCYNSFNPSVVVSPLAKLYVSPFESSASVGNLQEGRLVYPQKNHGNFSYVIDETDRKGWVPSSMIEAVCKRTNSGSEQKR